MTLREDDVELKHPPGWVAAREDGALLVRPPGASRARYGPLVVLRRCSGDDEVTLRRIGAARRRLTGGRRPFQQTAYELEVRGPVTGDPRHDPHAITGSLRVDD